MDKRKATDTPMTLEQKKDYLRTSLEFFEGMVNLEFFSMGPDNRVMLQRIGDADFLDETFCRRCAKTDELLTELFAADAGDPNRIEAFERWTIVYETETCNHEVLTLQGIKVGKVLLNIG